MRSKLLLAACLPLAVLAQKKGKPVDLLVYNARIYTVDEKFSVAQAIAVRNGRIEAIGTSRSLLAKYEPTRKINAEGKFIYPGFIDAHAHFYNYGLGLKTADLVDTKSWDEILSKLLEFAKENPEGWITGRGWDQNDWDVKEFPTRDRLDALFPDRPVVLTRVDGHAAIANGRALELAGVRAGDTLTGGTVETKNGRLTGILVDNATDLVYDKVPDPTTAQRADGLLAAQSNCFAVGLTTVDDCGLSAGQVLFIDSLQKTGKLKMRIYAMLSDNPRNYDFAFSRGPIKTDRLNVRSFKVYADGALGSRGAALLTPYTDRPGWSGFLLSAPAHFDSVARLVAAHKDWQLCTHAIGDSGNRIILQLYGKYLEKPNDRRWRIEHAQVVNREDFALFGAYSIIPSVQPTHATSDMYWAGDRLGPKRVTGAYAYKQLLGQNGWIPLGTDFPVEDISPFRTFLAAVFRVDAKGYPSGGYQVANALSREQALRGMTIWAARSNFEEGEKGSLETGKLADFIILDRDLMTIPAKDVLQSNVLATYVGGVKVYGK
ncbi:MAG: amidohydrolase [Flaviaesturariibacter sp.]|nr:amidohydrolase [Flaviaesturariibacter sp.]